MVGWHKKGCVCVYVQSVSGPVRPRRRQGYVGKECVEEGILAGIRRERIGPACLVLALILVAIAPVRLAVEELPLCRARV